MPTLKSMSSEQSRKAKLLMNKVAVVSGAAKGLGRAMALALARDGYTLVVHYRKSSSEAHKVLDEIKADSPDSIIISADVTIEADVAKMFGEIVKKFKRVDLLVNNVGNFLYKNLGKTNGEEFRDVIQSNVYSAFYCAQSVLPLMRRQKSGHIINIGAVGCGDFVASQKAVPFFMAKNALYFLTKAMAWEEAKNGIHVNMISPASLVTDIFKPSDFPMGRSANYDDVVKVLRFLTSADAYYINGANIEVAGAFIPGMKAQ